MMIRRRFLALVVAFAGLLLIAFSAAAESPRQVWVKTKCAVCHGIDGSGQTESGRKTNTPDLRAVETQKLTDAELTRSIAGGHKRMPAFQRQVNVERVRLLVAYIRGLVKAQ